MFDLRDTSDGFARAPYFPLEEEGGCPPPGRRRPSVTRPRLFILAAVALLVVGIFVAAVVVLVADKVNRKNDNGADSADVPSDSQLDLDQSVTQGSKGDVTYLRTVNERGGAVGSPGMLAVKVPLRDHPSASLVNVSSASSKGNDVSAPQTPPPPRGQYVASNDDDTRRWYEGVKALDVENDSSKKVESDSRWPESVPQDGPAGPKNDQSVENYVRDVAGSLLSQKDAV